jgi:hypothetical protein
VYDSFTLIQITLDYDLQLVLIERRVDDADDTFTIGKFREGLIYYLKD